MGKLSVAVGFIILTVLFSCTQKQDKINLPVSANNKAKADSAQPVASPGVNSVEALLPELPLLRFPIEISVDGFKQEKAIPLAMEENQPWLAPSINVGAETKVSAVGKFYFDLKIIGVFYYVSFPGEFSDEPGKEEIILTLFNTETGTLDSRSLAFKGDGMLGSSRMKTNEEGKKFVQLEMNDVKVTSQSFEIKEGKFVLTKSKDKSFSATENGRRDADLHIKNWMK